MDLREINELKSDMDKFSQNLKNLLEEFNMTQRELGNQIDMTEGSISKYLSGERIPKYDKLIKMATVLRTTPEKLLGIGNQEDTELDSSEIIRIPVFKSILYSDDLSINNPNIIRSLQVAKNRYSNSNRLFALEIQLDEMNPRIMKGDTVIFEEFNMGIDTVNTGDICLVSRGNETAVIREMAVKDDVYCFNLMNVTMPPRMHTISEMRKLNIHIIGRALTLVHDFKERR